jgi:flavin reductase (DIM6/NTAB) family NADH-FMN oxidoreductase RutF
MALIEDLKEITNGIYVLTVRHGEIRHGMSSSWVTQVSGEPPLVLASIDPRHFSHGLVRAAGRFGLNVVGRGSRSLEDFFYSPAAKPENNLARFAIVDSPSGVPLLADALAGFDCAVVDERAAGDHTLFVGRVDWIRRGPTDSPLTTLDLEYVYLGTGRIVKR